MDKIIKNLWKKAGIYCIVNVCNQKKYIGSSKNLYRRLMSHRSALRKGIHENKKLQNSWNKHGEDNFQYYILEYCQESNLISKEQYYINHIKPWYNIVQEVERLSFPEESRTKMSISRKIGIASGSIKLYQEKPIYQYSLDGFYLREYKSIKEASSISGVARSSINRFLEGKYKKGGNFLWSLTKEDRLLPYIKPFRDNSYFNKPIIAEDIIEGTTTEYDSLMIFCNNIGKNYSAVRHAFKAGYPYMKRYMIRYRLSCN